MNLFGSRAVQYGLRISLILAALLFTAASVGTAAAEKRVALVVGNSKYESFATLANPANDAASVAKVLRSADFQVIEALDKSRLDLEDTVRNFMRQLDGADVGLFYYSGHAVQVDGRNFLIPIDAKLVGANDLDFEAFDIGNLQRYMEQRVKMRLVFLDACRDNPFKGREFSTSGAQTRSLATRGLAMMRADVGTLIAYSTDPGDVALDGSAGDMSPFTASFVKHALTPSLEIRRLLSQIRADVLQSTDNKQRPWEESSLTQDFYFTPPRAAPIVVDMYRLDVEAGGQPSIVAAPAPQQPEGGSLKITVEELPSAGQVLAAGKPLQQGSQLSIEEFAGLEFDPSSLSPAAIEMLRYRVDDDWGNSKSALIVFSAIAGKVDAPTLADGGDSASQTLAEKLVAALAAPRLVTIGVGPTDLAIAALDAEPASRWLLLKVRKTPPLGELRLGERIVREGETLAVADLKGLTYTPHSDPGERSSAIDLDVVAPGGKALRKISVKMKIKETDCDLLAAEPLDLQGVSKGVAPNEIKIEDAYAACLTAVADHPDIARFFFQLGRIELARGNTKQAIELLKTAAARSHFRAETTLAEILWRGAGGETDVKSALSLLDRAAANGDPYALHALGKRLYHGDRVAQDRKRGLTLMLQAAEMGHTYAMNELGSIFESGDGVKPDPERALGFFKISVERNDIYGYNNMAYLISQGKAGPADPKQALELYIKAYKGGHPYAATNVGLMYYNGTGVEKDKAQAALWYGLAADRGDPYASNNLGFMLLQGEAGEPDPAKAAVYYAHAIALDQQEPRAAAELALIAIDEAQQAVAIGLLLKDLGFEPPKSPGKLSAKLRQALSAEYKARGIGEPKGTTKTLVALARLKWLKSRPRFDLF